MYPNYTKHNHEFLGSTKLSDGHVHRFAGVTFEGIVVSNGRHRHRFRTNTDFFADHHHSISGITGLNISVSNGRHIHFVVLSRCQGDGVVDNFQSRTPLEVVNNPVPLTPDTQDHINALRSFRNPRIVYTIVTELSYFT